MKKVFIPLALFIALAIFLALGLKLKPSEVPSPLIAKPAPAFSLPRLEDPSESMSAADLKGKVWLLNVWASWCVACREEHHVLVEFSKTGVAPVYGLNYKEVRGDGALDASTLSPQQETALARERANRWLAAGGNPYAGTIMDLDGRVGIDYGVYGVPETFLIDKQGVIRYKHIGPVTQEALQTKIVPLIKKLQG
jgi:cytochrome c biogenesis protein CcmG, thiol:disulfide interchange protein DsbE